MNDLKIYVGYDPREDLAYEVCRHSILTRTPGATVYPIKKTLLEKTGWYYRPVDRLASTEFTFTRFLVPALTHYRGWHCLLTVIHWQQQIYQSYSIKLMTNMLLWL